MKSKPTATNRLTTRFTVLASLLFTLTLSASFSASSQVLHPKLSSKQTTIRKVVILPAKVEIVRSGMKGPEGMAAESEQLSIRVEEAFTAALANKKKIATVGSAPSGETTYTVADIQTKFDDLLPKIRKKAKDVKKARFSLGDEVLNLNLDKTADAIIFIRGQGQTLTGGKKAFTMLVGGAGAHMLVQVCAVDARTGEVLYYAEAVVLGDPTTAEERLRKAMESSIKKLPIA
jgi:hypothetical protein